MAPPSLLHSTLDPRVDEALGRRAADADQLPARPSLFDGTGDYGPDDQAAPEATRTPPDSLEAQLAAVRAELARQQAIAADHEARAGELELAVARVRRAADHEIEYTTSNLVRAHAIAVADRDRAVAQHEEAIEAREAAVRTRQRMEAQRDEAIAQRKAAEARRDEAIVQRNDARRERDDVRAAHRSLQKHVKHAPVQTAAKRSPSKPDAIPATDRPPAVGDGATDATAPVASAPVTPRTGETSEHGVTSVDRWGIRILVTTGGLCFMVLLLFLIKALLGL